MKINLDTVIKDSEDQPHVETLPDQSKLTLTLRLALKRALAGDLDENGSPLRGEAKLERYALWLKVKNCKANVLELTPEELSAMRKTVLGFPVIFAGQIHAILAG